MGDPLSRICGIPDLTAAERLQLDKELGQIGAILSRIGEGAGFCEDRGFGWTSDMESAEGSDVLFGILNSRPLLRRLLPSLRHLRHEANPVIGCSTAPQDEVAVAKLLLSGTHSFSNRFGEGWDKRAITVTLEPESIHVVERTTAGGVGDQPFDSSETFIDYSEFATDKSRQLLLNKLGEAKYHLACSLAERMTQARVPCDLCGRTSQTFLLSGLLLSYDSPFSASGSDPVTVEQLAALRDALASHDLPAVRLLKREWTEGYCAKCDASYCKKHLQWGQEGPEYLWVNPYARCPKGHCWDL